jgi:hypothetical protein
MASDTLAKMQPSPEPKPNSNAPAPTSPRSSVPSGTDESEPRRLAELKEACRLFGEAENLYDPGLYERLNKA